VAPSPAAIVSRQRLQVGRAGGQIEWVRMPVAEVAEAPVSAPNVIDEGWGDAGGNLETAAASIRVEHLDGRGDPRLAVSLNAEE
jgi:hypothetical protein